MAHHRHSPPYPPPPPPPYPPPPPHLCQAEPAPAALVELSAAAGYVREWNFKAPSGFTAVGLRPSDAPLPVCGVLFEACWLGLGLGLEP